MEKCIAKERGEDHVGWGCVDVEWSVEFDDGSNGDQRINENIYVVPIFYLRIFRYIYEVHMYLLKLGDQLAVNQLCNV